MKSRRVTRFLAFGLAVCMTSVPVFASGQAPAGTADIKTQAALDAIADQTIEVGFGVADTVINVNVPTQATVRVQPLGSGNQTTVSQSNVASKDLKIINKTYQWTNENKTAAQGVPLKVSARAGYSAVGEGVNTYFDKDITDDAQNDDRFKNSCEKKNIWLQLRAGSFSDPTDISSNITYAGNEKSTITTLGSKIVFGVSAPDASAVSNNDASRNVSDNAAGKGAMAIMGTAAKSARWAEGDVAVQLTYSVQTAGGSVDGTSDMPQLSNPSSTFNGSLTVPANVLGDAEITGFAVQDAANNSYGVQQLRENMVTVADATGTPAGKTVTIANDIMSSINSVKNTATNLLISLSDGRVLIVNFTTPR